MPPPARQPWGERGGASPMRHCRHCSTNSKTWGGATSLRLEHQRRTLGMMSSLHSPWPMLAIHCEFEALPAAQQHPWGRRRRSRLAPQAQPTRCASGWRSPAWHQVRRQARHHRCSPQREERLHSATLASFLLSNDKALCESHSATIIVGTILTRFGRTDRILREASSHRSVFLRA